MPIRILIADDEEDIVDLITQKFRTKIRAGELEFEFAQNGAQAFEKLNTGKFNVLFSDINMPVMDGLTLLSKVKEMTHWHVKPVMITAYGDMKNIRQAMNNGAFDFITKPINFTDFEATLYKTAEFSIQSEKAEEYKQKFISYEQDLIIAAEIQRSLLPAKFPVHNAFELFGIMKPARQVGGDFYDFMLLNNENLVLIVGDASGKGIPAAIFMALSRTIIRANTFNEQEPSVCMSRSNRLLSQDSTDAMFTTMVYSHINTQTGEMRYINAGHPKPIVIRGSEIIHLPSKNDLVLGINENYSYSDLSFQLLSGDRLFIFTDGITEAFNKADELFGDDALDKLISDSAGMGIQDAVKYVADKVFEHMSGVEQSDDITLLCFQYK